MRPDAARTKSHKEQSQRDGDKEVLDFSYVEKSGESWAENSLQAGLLLMLCYSIHHHGWTMSFLMSLPTS